MNRVLTNGFPKSGNHALVKACQLLGIPAKVEHRPFEPVQGKRILIKRDPRNIVISWLRFIRRPVTPGMWLSHFRQFDQDGMQDEIGVALTGSLVAELAKYEGWLADPECLVVRYESLIADDGEMKRIAEYCEVPFDPEAWQWLPGMTRTWSAEHSDWRKVWTANVASAFLAEGGAQLLTRWGYEL